MKNTIVIDIDTDRDPMMHIGKQRAEDLPKNEKEAKEIILKDMACLSEALVMLIQAADEGGYKDVEESIKDTETHLKRAFNKEVDKNSDKDTYNINIRDDFNCQNSNNGLEKCSEKCVNC